MASSSMVIDDFDVQRIAPYEVEANAPSGIHGRRPLASPVPLEPMQADTLQDTQIARRPRHVQGEHQVGRRLEIQPTKPMGPFALPHLAGGSVGPRADHGKNVLRLTYQAK